MIRTENGELQCICELCGTEEFGGTMEFAEFWNQLKDRGWRARKDGDTWEHRCPDCTQETP